MPQQDEVLASAGAKLARTEHPISVLRHKYQLESLRQEAARLQRAIEEGEEVLAGPVPLQPLWFWGPINWARRTFGRKQVVRQVGDPAAFKAKLDQVRQQKAELEKLIDERLVGILTPLNVGEDYEVNAHYYYVRRLVQASFPSTDTTPEQRKFQDEAVEFTCDHALDAKRLELSLKTAVPGPGGNLVLVDPPTRVLTTAEAKKLDPRLTREIWDQYRAAFELSEDELGK